MTESTTVAVRIRPLNGSELFNNEECIWTVFNEGPYVSLSPHFLCELPQQIKLPPLSFSKFYFSINSM